MTGNSNNNEIIINAPIINEMDLTGMLLEKFTPGTTYDTKTHTWTVPADIQDKLISQQNK